MEFNIKVGIEKVIEAKDEYEAGEKFWTSLEEDNGIENTTTENRLEESRKIEDVRRTRLNELRERAIEKCFELDGQGIFAFLREDEADEFEKLQKELGEK